MNMQRQGAAGGACRTLCSGVTQQPQQLPASFLAGGALLGEQAAQGHRIGAPAQQALRTPRVSHLPGGWPKTVGCGCQCGGVSVPLGASPARSDPQQRFQAHRRAAKPSNCSEGTAAVRPPRAEHCSTLTCCHAAPSASTSGATAGSKL